MVLRKERSLTPQMIRKLGVAMQLQAEELDAFITSLPQVEIEDKRKKQSMMELNRLAIDTFNVVSDWYHDAILELSRIPGLEPTPEVISRRLGVSIVEARAALERLERVGLIKLEPTGGFKEVLGDTTTVAEIDYTNSALRNLQKQALELSLKALEEVPKSHREHSCMTLAISTKDLPEAKRRIKNFRLEMMDFLQRKPKRFDEVYQLSVSMYPLSNLKNK